MQINHQSLSLAIAAYLLSRYEIPYAWDASLRRIMIGALVVAPTYLDDAMQASISWPFVELTLHTCKAPVILTGIIRPGASDDRAWCRVVEFAEEFGISVSYDPLVLGERRGG